MREMSDKNKLKKGRGSLEIPGKYEAFKMARESKSIGTACACYDPIQQRTINLLSQGEVKVFWTIRTYDKVENIYEQFPLKKDIVNDICAELNIRSYSNILSTDFVIITTDGSIVAISVKSNRKSFYEKDKSYDKRMRRMIVEELYWKRCGADFRIIFSDEIPIELANNCRMIMAFWDDKWITNTDAKLKHLIAKHCIRFKIPDCRLNFKRLAEALPIEEMFSEYKHKANCDDPDFRGWDIDISKIDGVIL